MRRLGKSDAAGRISYSTANCAPRICQEPGVRQQRKKKHQGGLTRAVLHKPLPRPGLSPSVLDVKEVKRYSRTQTEHTAEAKPCAPRGVNRRLQRGDLSGGPAVQRPGRPSRTCLGSGAQEELR